MLKGEETSHLVVVVCMHFAEMVEICYYIDVIALPGIDRCGEPKQHPEALAFSEAETSTINMPAAEPLQLAAANSG